MNPDAFLRMVWQTITSPAEIAEAISAQRFDIRVLWEALALCVVLSVLMLAAFQAVAPMPEELAEQMIVVTPLSYTVLLAAFMVFLVTSISAIGRGFGGTGDLTTTLTMLVWLQIVSLVCRVVQLFTTMIMPPLGGLVYLASLGALLWCLLNFVNVLHRFDSLAKSAGVIISAFVVAVLGAAAILVLIGVSVPGGMPDV